MLLPKMGWDADDDDAQRRGKFSGNVKGNFNGMGWDDDDGDQSHPTNALCTALGGGREGHKMQQSTDHEKNATSRETNNMKWNGNL